MANSWPPWEFSGVLSFFDGHVTPTRRLLWQYIGIADRGHTGLNGAGLANNKFAAEVEGVPMVQAGAAERWLVLLLRLIGGVCLLALVPLWMPRSWIDVGHRRLGWGAFPSAPIAEYLARSVSSLSAFYGGLLIALSFDVRRYIPLIRYQAVAVMLLSTCGVVVGGWAGLPRWFVGGDAVACWAYGVPMLVLAWRVECGRAEPGAAPDCLTRQQE